MFEVYQNAGKSNFSKWETKILFVLVRKMKSQPISEFKWRVDWNFEAKITIKGVSDKNISMISRLMFEQYHPTQCQKPGFESETYDNSYH